MTIFNNSLIKTLQIFVYLFPLSFMFGNSVTNFFVILIILSGLIYYKTDIFKWRNKYLFLVVLSFFLLILFNSYYHHLFIEANKDTIKSVFYFRYFFLLLVLRTLVQKNDININRFLIISLASSLFVSLDIILQFVFGKNVLGYNAIEFIGGVKYFTGIFNLELIAGGYILMFSTIGLFSIFNIFKTEKKIFYLFIFAFSVIIFLFSLILAGNRMPLIMFVVFIATFALIYKKKERIYFFSLTFLVVILVGLTTIYSENLYQRANNFYKGIPNIFVLLDELKKDYPNLEKYKNSGKQFHNLEEFNDTRLKSAINESSTNVILENSDGFPRSGKNFILLGSEEVSYIGISNNTLLNVERGQRNTVPQSHEKGAYITSSTYYKIYAFYTGHLPTYITSIDLFLEKPLIGMGIKSYRNYCSKKIHLPNRVCTSHPHNYILEILNDTGLLGLILIFYLVAYLLYNNYRDYKLDIALKTNISNWVYLALILSLFTHFFPFKSSGSFFSTFNSSFIFLILGISLGLNELKYQKYSNK